jgi:hypothetical protein
MNTSQISERCVDSSKALFVTIASWLGVHPALPLIAAIGMIAGGLAGAVATVLFSQALRERKVRTIHVDAVPTDEYDGGSNQR